jgi:hypothetical protein
MSVGTAATGSWWGMGWAEECLTKNGLRVPALRQCLTIV